MRVAVLSSTPPSPTEGSGTFVGLAGLVRGLGQQGLDVTFRALHLRTRLHTLDRWLYNAAVAWRPPATDVTIGVDLDGFLWARRRRTRFIAALKGVIADELTHERGWVRVLLGVQARWERLNAERADHVVTPSDYSAAVASRCYGIPRSKVSTIPEPLDLAAWRARLAGAARRPGSAPTVLAVARMYPRKHLEDLVKAAALVRRRIHGLRIRIVGTGPEFARVRALAARLDLGESIALLGDVTAEELAVEYVSADVFCLPSIQEAFGIVFAEAMAAGLPVVACRAAAVPEVVEDGRTGLLIAPRRPDELAAALERLLGDDQLRKELGAAGMERVEAFDMNRVARQWFPVLAP